MPKLVRFVLTNSLIGVAIGWAASIAFILMNVGGIGELFMRSDQKLIWSFIIAMSSGVTFGFAYLATAVMLVPTDKDDFERY